MHHTIHDKTLHLLKKNNMHNKFLVKVVKRENDNEGY